MPYVQKKTDLFNSYSIFGPTTIHLRQEVYLLISLLLLTLSSLLGLYKDTNATVITLGNLRWGDFWFLFLVTIWLSRHLVIRWICTCDNSTNRSPTLIGVVAHWMTSLLVGGQYYDRPNPQIIAKHLGTYYHADDGRNGPATLSSFFHPSILFTWQLIKIWVLFPALYVKEYIWNIILTNNNNNNNNQEGKGSSSSRLSSSRTTTINNNYNKSPSSKASGGSKRSSSSRRGRGGGGERERERTTRTTVSLKLNKVYSYWSKFWNMYGPPLQMMITLSTLFYYLWGLIFSSPTAAAADREVTQALTMNTRSAAINNQIDLNDMSNPLLDEVPYGAYSKLKVPAWGEMLFLMSYIGIMLSIVMFGRVVQPVGDLVAGGDVLKAVRNESKAYGFNPSGGKSKAKEKREHQDLPWAEQYKSIIGENRFRLICKLSSIRFAENILVCALLPCTGYACRFTGHCPEGASPIELSKVFYPAGIASTLRDDGYYQNQFSLLSADRGSAWMTLISVIVITGSVVFTQAATLNRSYLSIMGYLAGGWCIVDMKDPAYSLPSATSPSPWDPRRRYKKGDLIVQDLPAFGGKAIYVATTNAPEGIPYDLSLRATHDLFRNELGHPATSTMISFIIFLQLCLILSLMIMIGVYQFLGYHYGSLIWTLVANIVATYGTMRATAVPNLSEMEDLARDFSY